MEWQRPGNSPRPLPARGRMPNIGSLSFWFHIRSRHIMASEQFEISKNGKGDAKRFSAYAESSVHSLIAGGRSFLPDM